MGDSASRNPTRAEEEGFWHRKETEREITWKKASQLWTGAAEGPLGAAAGTEKEHLPHLAGT